MAQAYAPYSKYQVGAAILGADGKIYSGCNVENESYGLSICAERSAISAMVDAGCRQICEVVVLTTNGGTPCGMCRQVMFEFSKNETVLVSCLNEAGISRTFTVEELLPHAFRLEDK